MIFYINNRNGTGYRYPNKECFLEDLSELINELTEEGATYFDMTFETDAEIPIAKEITKLESGDPHNENQ